MASIAPFARDEIEAGTGDAADARAIAASSRAAGGAGGISERGASTPWAFRRASNRFRARWSRPRSVDSETPSARAACS